MDQGKNNTSQFFKKKYLVFVLVIVTQILSLRAGLCAIDFT